MILFTFVSKYVKCLFISVFTFCCLQCLAQDNTSRSNPELVISNKATVAISDRASTLSDKITVRSDKYLKKLFKQELKLYKKLKAKDSLLANELFTDIIASYDKLINSGSTIIMFPIWILSELRLAFCQSLKILTCSL
jgi:hypothetical protein